MKRIVVPLLLSFSLLSEAETLTLLNWEEFLSESVIKAWEAETGHHIKQVYYDNDEDRDELLIDYDGQKIDLVIGDELATQSFGRQGTLIALDAYQSPNIQNVDPQWQKQCGSYSLPYLWGTLGIVYRKDKFSVAPTSWEVLLKPEEAHRGHYGLMEDYSDLLSPALLYQNKSINTENNQDLLNAFELLKTSAKNALTFNYAITYLSSGKGHDQLYFALAYSGDQYALNEKSGEDIWEYTTLKEGTTAWLDCIGILSSSPRKELAFNFINYLYDIKVAAQNSEDVYSASPIPASKAIQSEEFQQDETVYPSAKIMQKAQNYKLMSDESILLRNRITSSLVKLNELK